MSVLGSNRVPCARTLYAHYMQSFTANYRRNFVCPSLIVALTRMHQTIQQGYEGVRPVIIIVLKQQKYTSERKGPPADGRNKCNYSSSSASNALLIRFSVTPIKAMPVKLPTTDPRDSVCIRLSFNGLLAEAYNAAATATPAQTDKSKDRAF